MSIGPGTGRMRWLAEAGKGFHLEAEISGGPSVGPRTYSDKNPGRPLPTSTTRPSAECRPRECRCCLQAGAENLKTYTPGGSPRTARRSYDRCRRRARGSRSVRPVEYLHWRHQRHAGDAQAGRRQQGKFHGRRCHADDWIAARVPVDRPLLAHLGRKHAARRRRRHGLRSALVMAIRVLGRPRRVPRRGRGQHGNRFRRQLTVHGHVEGSTLSRSASTAAR
jgi:hypothetical protein